MEPNTQSYRAAKRAEIAERRAKVSAHYRKNGWTVYQIAKELGCSVATVSEDMQALIAGWQRTADINTAAHVATELEKINTLEAEAWESLRISKQPRRVATARKSVTPVADGNGSTVTVESTVASATEIQQPAGDARFMSIIDRCIGSRMKLLGLENRGGMKEPEKDKGPTTWVEMIAKEIAEREAMAINVTSKAARLAAPRDTTPLRLP